MNKGLKSRFMLISWGKTVAVDSHYESDLKMSQMLGDKTLFLTKHDNQTCHKYPKESSQSSWEEIRVCGALCWYLKWLQKYDQKWLQKYDLKETWHWLKSDEQEQEWLGLVYAVRLALKWQKYSTLVQS